MSDKLRRILIVDDDIDILANLTDILSDLGYETVTACSGQSALEQIDASHSKSSLPFDLCLLDFRMPGMDGVELLKQIQAKQPKIPAIMITAYAGADGDKRAEAAGTLTVMKKPVDIKRLLRLIDAVVAC